MAIELRAPSHVIIPLVSCTHLGHTISFEPKQIKKRNKKKKNNKNKTQIIQIRPKLLNLAFCFMRYSKDVFFALADLKSSILSWKSGFLGTSSCVRDLVSLSFCSIASCTWLANTGIVLSLEARGTRSEDLGSPETGGLCVNFALNIFILSAKDILAGSSSSNLAATVSAFIYYIVHRTRDIHSSK